MIKNCPLLLIIVCLALGALVWFDNRPSGDAERPHAAAVDAGNGAQAQPDDEQLATADPAADPTPAEGAEAVVPPKSGNPLASFDKSRLKDTVGRPLFSPSRKRPPETVAASGEIKAAAPVVPIYDLLGVMHDGGRAIALMRKKSDGTSFRVQPGDMIGGWQVSKVEPQAVVLTRPDGGSETVPLFRE